MYDTRKPYKAKIADLIRTTWDTPWVTVEDGLYPVLNRKWQGYEVQHTDGIGSKGLLHYENSNWEGAVLDALAMNFNDLLLVKARPVTLQNHIMIQEDNHDAVLKIVDCLAANCRRRQVAMTGGETAVLNNLEGMEISLTVTGIMECSHTNSFVTDNVVVGIPSSGLHANGFTFVRQAGLVKHPGLRLLTPTRMYWDEIYKHVPFVDGMMHVTGGGWTKLLDVIDPGQDVVIKKLNAQDVFGRLKKSLRFSDEKMYQTFNCGYGFVLCVCKDYVGEILNDVVGAQVIGTVVQGAGRVVIDSAFSENKVVFSKSD